MKLRFRLCLGTNPLVYLGADLPTGGGTLLAGDTVLLVLLPALLHPVSPALLLRLLLTSLHPHRLALVPVLRHALLLVTGLAVPLHNLLALLHLLRTAGLSTPGLAFPGEDETMDFTKTESKTYISQVVWQ